MMRGVSRRGHNQHVFGLRQRHTLFEWANCPGRKLDPFRLPPLWQTMWQIALNAAAPSLRALELLLRHPDFASRQVCQASCVIGMKMSQHNMAYISWGNAQRTK